MWQEEACSRMLQEGDAPVRGTADAEALRWGECGVLGTARKPVWMEGEGQGGREVREMGSGPTTEAMETAWTVFWVEWGTTGGFLAPERCGLIHDFQRYLWPPCGNREGVDRNYRTCSQRAKAPQRTFQLCRMLFGTYCCKLYRVHRNV